MASRDGSKRRVVMAHRLVYFLGYIKSFVFVARIRKLAQCIPGIASMRGRVETVHVCFPCNLESLARMFAVMAAVSFSSWFFVFHLNEIKRIK